MSTPGRATAGETGAPGVVARRAVTGGEVARGDVANEPSDGMLVARVLRGERAAFAPLVRRHQASLFRRALGMGLDSESAADMVQDALVKAWDSLESCRDPDRFGVWAATILRNRCLDFLKSAARRGTPLHHSLPSQRGNPEREGEQSELRSTLNTALSRLPDEQREAFLMKHGEGRAYEEMAQLAGVSVSAMKMRVHRARESLQAELGPLHGEP